jgi:hypothetical protein
MTTTPTLTINPTPTRPAGAVRRPSQRDVTSTAERAECTCPDYCERDHDRD